MTSLSGSEKKRLRDRKAQKTQRDKRESHVRNLEDRVAFCERHHGAGWIQQLLMSVEGLRRENERLRARQGQLRRMMMSWEAEDGHVDTEPASASQAYSPFETAESAAGLVLNKNDSDTNNTTPTGTSAMTSTLPPGSIDNYATDDTRTDVATTIFGSVSLPNTPTAASNILETIHLPRLPVSSAIQTMPSTVPAWSLLPINEHSSNDSFHPATCSWLSRTDLIAACPPEPSPLDLLHGTRRNFLADQIHRAIRLRAIRDSECLALGWVIYLFCKWCVSPNPVTFARLPAFQRPITAQLQRGHPASFDMIVWPQMRASLIENWTMYDFPELTAYLSCCVKVRWPWGKDVLERDADDNLQVKREFFDVFIHESGWGLTSEFIEKYPALLKGMDVEAVRFQISLPEVGD